LTLNTFLVRSVFDEALQGSKLDGSVARNRMDTAQDSVAALQVEQIELKLMELDR
jgi:hypothetical protein